MGEVAIKAVELCKSYELRHSRTDANGNKVNEVEALSNVSFEVLKGESIGIIGPNGSGKSTLLKILAGVTKPTSGTAEVNGKVASILDIGAGFHPELSGRENIYLNGQIHGFSRATINSKLDEIVDFSGVENFIDEPVKNYSNGMYLRLAFSIMCHLDFDVYLFDEVFSVGDAAFGLKTKAKFEEFKRLEKTLLSVSHNPNELLNQGDYILLEQGKMKERTGKKSLLSDYLENVLIAGGTNVNESNVMVTDFSGFTMGEDVKMLSVSCSQDHSDDKKFRTDHPFRIQIEYEKLKDEDSVDVLLNVLDSGRNVILTSAPFVSGNFNRATGKGKHLYTCVIPSRFFNSQVYYLNLVFFKNLNSTVSGDTLQLKSNRMAHIVCSLERVLAFKPILTIPEMRLDPNVIINTQAGLLPGFEWSLEVDN